MDPQEKPKASSSLTDEQIVNRNTESQSLDFPRVPLKHIRELAASAKSMDNPSELIGVPLKTLLQMLAVAEKYQQLKHKAETSRQSDPNVLEQLTVLPRTASAADVSGDFGDTTDPGTADFNDLSSDPGADTDTRDMSGDTDTAAGLADSKAVDNDG